MPQFLGMPKVQFFDSAGAPLNGGKLYVYDVGTTDARNSYPTIADAIAKTNANANPVILDSRGEANVVLVGNSKLVLDDSNDVNIWSIDNVEEDSDLLDGNGNEMIVFSDTASAVNHLQIANGATAGGPEIAAVGSDANVDLLFASKGTGVYIFKGTNDTAAEIRLREDADNGSNYMSWKSPAAITTSTSLVLPDGDGTVGQHMFTDGSGTLAWGGGVLQMVSTSTGTAGSTATTIPVDATIPQNTEGAELFTLAITPKSASSNLVIDIHIPVIDVNTADTIFSGAIFVDSTADALAAATQHIDATADLKTFTLRHIVSSGSTSARTYKFRYGPETGTGYILQQNDATDIFSSAAVAYMTVTEYA